MELRARWFFVEATKLALILGLFVWLQTRIVETRHEVYASTDRLVDRHASHATRLLDLEANRAEAGETLAETSETVNSFREALLRREELIESKRASLEQLVNTQSEELRSQIQKGIDRLEGTSHSAYSQSQRVDRRVRDLERRLRRSSSSMKHRMLYPVAQLRGNGTVGSGVVIASRKDNETDGYRTYVVTAFHVVQEILAGSDSEETISDIRFLEPLTDLLEEAPRSATILAENEDADLALLRVDMDERWPFVAELATPDEMARASIFDSVYAVGCPLGNKPLPTVGEISCQKKMVGGQNFWMINAPTFFGNSGGGVFLSESGRLLGVSSMIYTYGKRQPMVVPHMGLFVPLATVKDWIEDTGYGYTLVDQKAAGRARPAGSTEAEKH